MKYIFILLMLVLSGCATTQVDSNAPSINTNGVVSEVKVEPTESQKIYFLQHRLLPEWTYESDGRFFDDLAQGKTDKLKEIAEEVVSLEYAKQINTKSVEGGNAVLITFAVPLVLPNCFYVLIRKTEEGLSYYTYEKTMSLDKNDSIVGVVGHWSKDKAHGNLGVRTYNQAADFVKDILSRKN